GRRSKTYFVPKLPPGTGFVYNIEGTEQSYTANNAATIVTSYGPEGADEVTFYDAQQRVVHRVTLERDGGGRMLREEARLGDAGLGTGIEAALMSAAAEAPEAAGRLAQLFAPDNLLAATDYTYDAAGRLVEKSSQMGGGMSEERTVYLYDDRGNRVGETHEETTRDMMVGEEGKPTPANE